MSCIDTDRSCVTCDFYSVEDVCKIDVLSYERGREDERTRVIGLLYETNMNCHNCHCNDECNFSKADCIEFLSKYISEMLGK